MHAVPYRLHLGKKPPFSAGSLQRCAVITSCPTCGRSLDAHDRHVRFTLPDPVLAAPERERTPGTWMSEPDPRAAVMMQVPNVGPFVRVLLPVSLGGGYHVTFGIWLGVSPDDLQRAYREWWAPTYPELVLDGVIANNVQPWGLLGRRARAVVRDPDATPEVTDSIDPEVKDVVTKEWAHDYVIDALPEALR